MLGIADGSTTALMADTVEAERAYVAEGQAAFRAFFAFAPFCRIEFADPKLRPYAPGRIYIGERDDMTPAAVCVDFAKSLRSKGGDVAVTVYAGAEHRFDYVPPAIVTPPQDPAGRHPHGETFTYSLLPYYVSFADNLAGCTFHASSIFQRVTREDVSGCARKGVHIASDPTSAYVAREDLKGELARLLYHEAGAQVDGAGGIAIVDSP